MKIEIKNYRFIYLVSYRIGLVLMKVYDILVIDLFEQIDISNKMDIDIVSD